MASPAQPRKFNVQVAERLMQKLGEIESITAYLWDEELPDFYEQQEAGEDTSDHVFRDVVAVDNAIYDTDKTPEEYVEERYAKPSEPEPAPF